MEKQGSLPERYWEIGNEENGMSDQEIAEAQEWIENNGIPEDPELPFN